MHVRNAFFGFLALTGAVAASVSPANAVEYFTGYVGWYDISKDEDAPQFGVEWRGEYLWQNLRPMVGANVTTDGSAYAYAGFNYDWMVASGFYIIPNLAVGVYGQGDGKDLGHAIEFRSGLEFAYEMDNLHRVGVAVNHVSNASIGTKNPGSETLLFSYSLPY